MIKIFTLGIFITFFSAAYCGICWHFIKQKSSKGIKRNILYFLFVLFAANALSFGFYHQFEFIYPAHYGKISYFQTDSDINQTLFQKEVMNVVPSEVYGDLDRLIVTKDMNEPRSFFLLLGKNKKNVNGDYFPSTDTLRVKQRQIEIMKEIWAHEVGHKYWFDRLDKKEQNEWIKLHNQSERYPSLYARTNPEEDFAEHFSCVFYKRGCTTSREKMNFISDKVLSRLHLTFEIVPSGYENFYLVELREFRNNQNKNLPLVESYKALPLLS